MFVRGCEKFVPALAYLFCLALPGSCLARFAYLLADLCTIRCLPETKWEVRAVRRMSDRKYVNQEACGVDVSEITASSPLSHVNEITKIRSNSSNQVRKVTLHVTVSNNLQGDTARCLKPPVDFKTKVPFWPALA